MNDSDEGYDEDFDEPSPDAWKFIASEADNGRWWEENCPIIEEACGLLTLLEELDDGDSALPELINGLSRLQQFPEMSFPPLSDIKDFQLYFDDDPFLVLTTQPDSNVCSAHRLYITADEPEKTEPLLAEFEELVRRLKAYPPLKRFLD
jgi:hypothetical protein